ncbi:MAG: NAD(P)-dependent alcohol dehydrogenase [Bacillota bacterium]|nr:NAD(P)-dependent alcohol dehydrogenase [Bacillota bacterium]
MEMTERTSNRCLYLDAQHQLTLLEKPIPEPGIGEVLVRIKANGICGSDVHFYQDGRLGPFIVDQPYIPGHESSGCIAAIGADVNGLKVGDDVVIEPGIPCGHCHYCRMGRYNLCPDVIFLSAPPVDGTFCDYIVVRADAALIMPAGMSYETAAMAEPAAVAVHAVNRARFALGATALVVGAGPIGLLVAQAFQAAGGGPVYCSDLQEKRLQIAERIGALRWDTYGRMPVDVVFDTSGSAKACSTLFAAARPGGCVVQVGWPAGNLVTLDIADFINKELDYVSVNRYANAFPTAMKWLADGKIRTEHLVTHRFTLDQAADAFQYTTTHPADVIKTIVTND